MLSCCSCFSGSNNLSGVLLLLCFFFFYYSLSSCVADQLNLCNVLNIAGGLMLLPVMVAAKKLYFMEWLIHFLQKFDMELLELRSMGMLLMFGHFPTPNFVTIV